MGYAILNGGERKIETLNRKYSTYEDRKKVIEKIRDVRYGDAFKYYKEKFYVPDKESYNIDDSIQRKLFTNYKLLDQIINAFVSYCPILEPPTPETDNEQTDKRTRLYQKAMQKIKWNELCTQIYDSLESEGDVFFYIYFDEKEDDDSFYLPRLKYLDSINMTNIIVDEANQPKVYIYKEKAFDEIVDYKTGDVEKTNERDVTYIFEKGNVHKIDSNIAKKGEILTRNEKGNIIVSKTIKNKDFYQDEIPIIHIHSKKRQDEKFSLIPSEDYVDLCLHLAQIQSDIRATNRQLGFPRITLLDCVYVDGDGSIGGVKIAKSVADEDSLDNKQGQVIQHNSATNESFFTEEKNVTDYLYNLVCITNPTLMNRVGSSDSSKVLQQVNQRMEKKIESYINNIIDGFKIYFKILLLANGMYNADTDIDISFKKPKSIIKNSVYDENLIKQQELNNGTKTIQALLRDEGKTNEYIEQHMKELNEEQMNGNNDIQVSKEITTTVKNANNKE